MDALNNVSLGQLELSIPGVIPIKACSQCSSLIFQWGAVSTPGRNTMCLTCATLQLRNLLDNASLKVYAFARGSDSEFARSRKRLDCKLRSTLIEAYFEACHCLDPEAAGVLGLTLVESARRVVRLVKGAADAHPARWKEVVSLVRPLAEFIQAADGAQ